MKQFTIWDRKSTINGVAASHFLNQTPFKGYAGEIILIKTEDGSRVTNVECKDILADVYGIDKALSMDSFMVQYFAKLEARNSAAQTEQMAE